MCYNQLWDLHVVMKRQRQRGWFVFYIHTCDTVIYSNFHRNPFRGFEAFVIEINAKLALSHHFGY